MFIVILFVSFILFLLADWAVREWLRSAKEQRQRRERAEALAVSLKLDFTRESKTLKRVEVKDPLARILCVDDEAVILEGFRKILALEGYSVDTVETGPEALGLVQQHHYDFVFTDLKMPGLDGVDVTKSVKHMRPDIDVVIVTGFATIETAVDCMKHGATDYVQKPFTGEELTAFVKKALIRRQDRIRRELLPRVHVTHALEGEKAAASEFAIPGGVLVSSGHCWVALGEEGAVRVGLDDFAKKLIGKVDALEFPGVGMTVKAGQVLFSVRQKGRSVPFQSPVSGKVTKINTDLREDCSALDTTPYHENWVCVIDGDNLDAEIKELKIGKSAVALFQEDIARVRALLKEAGREGVEPKLHSGELGELPAGRWESAASEFFRR